MSTKRPEMLIKTPTEKAPKCYIEKPQEVDRPQTRALHLIDSCSTFAEKCGTSFFTTDFRFPPFMEQEFKFCPTIRLWSVHRPECRRLSCVTVWCFLIASLNMAGFMKFHSLIERLSYYPSHLHETKTL